MKARTELTLPIPMRLSPELLNSPVQWCWDLSHCTPHYHDVKHWVTAYTPMHTLPISMMSNAEPLHSPFPWFQMLSHCTLHSHDVKCWATALPIPRMPGIEQLHSPLPWCQMLSHHCHRPEAFYQILTCLIWALWVYVTYLFTKCLTESCDSPDWLIQYCLSSASSRVTETVRLVPLVDKAPLPLRI